MTILKVPNAIAKIFRILSSPSSAMVAKKLGCRGFCGDFWHMADLSTILISLAAIAMYVAKMLSVMKATRLISETRVAIQ